MGELTVFTEILIVSAAVLVLGWLTVSFMAPGRARSVVEWMSAMAMYVAIGSIMTRLLHRFWVADNLPLIGVFGFLTLVFGSGLLVSTVNCLRALAGHGGSASEGATH